ncbi:Transmembrane protein 85 [Harpegnathos saltator]|uniref:ER membrane protein complex subunit 4 n=1 Tax=Harpegnathos saltator TaxID=610380 RepID=E2BIK7_HARSA|nr:Transmembrane protein 85 [Harpegnathos saltator]
MTTSSKQGSKRSKWALDFAHKTKQDKSVEIPSPPGYTPTGSLFHNVEYMRESDSNHLIIKKSWDLALGPLKQVPMNLFIMYMAGNSISIFPIMMVCMLIIRPVKALFTLQQRQLVNIALALYKCQSMGLLPTHASDWLAFVEPQARVEYSGGGFIYI